MRQAGVKNSRGRGGGEGGNNMRQAGVKNSGGGGEGGTT